MAITGIKDMEIMAIMVTIIKDMEAMVATIILVTTIMDMVTTMVRESISESPSLLLFLHFSPIFRSHLY